MQLDYSSIDERIVEDFLQTVKKSGIIFKTDEEQYEENAYAEVIKKKAGMIRNILKLNTKVTP